MKLPALAAVVAFLLLLLPGLLGPYGPFIDEHYYVACSERLAWGYVDHPPLAPALLHVSRALLGDGLFALRLPVALAGALLVLGTGLLSRRLGASGFGQGLACAALLAAPLFQIMFSFFSMNAFEIVLWGALVWILVEIELGGSPRLWLLFGALAGLALLNKHTVMTLVLAVGVGIVLTPARRHLRSPWLWLGALLAVLLAVPNVLWQVHHGWPSLEFYRNAALEKQVRPPALQVLLAQVIFVNPGTLAVWLAGLVLLWKRRELRHLTIAYLALLAMMLLGREGRPDRIAGVYPLLFAAGGLWWETRLRTGARWLRPALFATLLVFTALLLPLGIPLFPPAATARWAVRLGVVPQMERGAGKRTQLPQWFADRLGWEQLVDDVAAARESLSSEERERVVYFAPSYGQAGALEWLGRARHLVPVYCTHNNYFLWGPPRDPVDVAIVIGRRREDLERLFAEVTLVKLHECGYCMPWRNEMPIWIVRGPRVRIADEWPRWKHFE